MNIVLIGYRGTGKSAVASLLAEDLKMHGIEMDSEIVKKAGLTIPEIVETYGWEKFRDFESALALELSELDNVVIDTGGGIIERPENIDTLKKNGLIFWLKASVDVIVGRIESGTERPALTDGKSFTKEVAEVLAKRTSRYSSAADYEINTDDISPAQVAASIIDVWKKMIVHASS